MTARQEEKTAGVRICAFEWVFLAQSIARLLAKKEQSRGGRQLGDWDDRKEVFASCGGRIRKGKGRPRLIKFKLRVWWVWAQKKS